MGIDEELAARAARARDVALFRYGLIRAAADPGLSPRQRGALVRALAAGQHQEPGGQLVRVGRCPPRSRRAPGVPPNCHQQPMIVINSTSGT